MIYVDSTALIKLVAAAPETPALQKVLAADRVHVASAIVEVEVLRIVRRQAPELLDRARRVVEHVALIELDAAIRARAAALEPAGVRVLDALHLATALEARDALSALVTYDGRLAAAAASRGLRFLSPA